MNLETLADWRQEAERDQQSGFGLGWPARIIALADALEEMTREARLSREAAERAVASRFARHEIERALRAVDVYDAVASDEDVIFHDGAMHAVKVIRDMLGLDDA